MLHKLEWDRLIIAAFKVFAEFLTSLDKYDGIGYHLPGILHIQIGLSMDAEVAAFICSRDGWVRRKPPDKNSLYVNRS